MTYRLHGLLAIVALLMALPAPLTAHEGRPVYIEVTEQANSLFHMRWKIPPVLRASEVPSIQMLGGDCMPTARQAPTLSGSAIYTCEPGSRPRQIELTYGSFNPALSTLVVFSSPSTGENHLLAGPDQRVIGLPKQQGFLDTAVQYAWAGFDHILEGLDHLLFVFCLLVLVGSPGRILLAVTGFTIGHSVTLGLTALYGISLPPPFVEPLIALSIVMLASEKLLGDQDTLAVRRPAIISSLFGLLHGFGFGGALAEIGLPYSYKLTALAFFNIGVELGQVAFVIVVLLIGWALQASMVRSKLEPDRGLLTQLILYPAGLTAGYWTIERLASLWT